MSQPPASSSRNAFRFVLLLFLALGLFSFQAISWSGRSVAAADLPTATPTRQKIVAQGGFCGINKSRLELSLQHIVINATRSVTSVKCGRLVFLTNVDSEKRRITPEKPNGKARKDTGKAAEEFIGLLPCSGGGPLIFQIRPRELLDYYQFVNLKLGSGKTIYTEDYGALSQYITSFETYYPLSSCNDCGTTSQSYYPYSTAEFIYPGTPQSSSLAPSIPTFNQRTASSGLVFPTSTPTATPTIAPVTGSASTNSVLSLAQLETFPFDTPTPLLSETRTVTLSVIDPIPTGHQPTASPHAVSANSDGGSGPVSNSPASKIKPATFQANSGFFSYSIYTR